MKKRSEDLFTRKKILNESCPEGRVPNKQIEADIF